MSDSLLPRAYNRRYLVHRWTAPDRVSAQFFSKSVEEYAQAVGEASLFLTKIATKRPSTITVAIVDSIGAPILHLQF